jgi:hypothetical protein
VSYQPDKQVQEKQTEYAPSLHCREGWVDWFLRKKKRKEEG